MKRLRALFSWSATLRIALGGIFFYAGVIKLHQPQALASSIASFRVLPDAWIPQAAACLPFFEALAGFWLLLGWRARSPALALLGLNALFTLAVAQAFVRGLNITCACFGAGFPGSDSIAWIFARDVLLLVASAVLYRNLCRQDAASRAL